MTNFTLQNPVFVTYLICAALGVLKVMGQGWMTVYRLTKADAGFASPEDAKPGPLNKNPRPGQVDVNDYVDRSRRMHRNDLENVLPFLAAGLIFVAVSPPLLLAQILMYGFVIARAAHTVAYATTQPHEIRASFYTIGSFIVIYMALHALVVVLAGIGQG